MRILHLLSEQQNIPVAQAPGLPRYEPKHRQQILTKTWEAKFSLTMKESKQPPAYSS